MAYIEQQVCAHQTCTDRQWCEIHRGLLTKSSECQTPGKCCCDIADQSVIRHALQQNIKNVDNRMVCHSLESHIVLHL